MSGQSSEAADSSLAGRQKLFHLVMIKPTHYDDDGYPIQWFRSAIPSNTLACLNGLAEDARARDVLGPDVELRLHTYDETNRRVRPDQIIRMIRKTDGRALIALRRRLLGLMDQKTGAEKRILRRTVAEIERRLRQQDHRAS